MDEQPYRKDPGSVARPGDGFGVGASPLNPVKLELGLWLLGCVPVLLLLTVLDASPGMTILGALLYGAAGMARVVWRVRRLLSQLDTDPGRNQHGA